jgi:hypothetical protein
MFSCGGRKKPGIFEKCIAFVLDFENLKPFLFAQIMILSQQTCNSAWI